MKDFFSDLWNIISHDVKLHFYAGIAIALVAYLLILIAYIIFPNLLDYSTAFKFVALAGVGIGAAKEVIWDKLLKKGTPEVGDFVATGIGTFLVIFVVEAIRLILFP